MTRLALLSRQILTYHHARLNALSGSIDRLDVLSLANEAKFSQLLSDRDAPDYEAHFLYESLVAYRAAAKDGSLGDDVTAKLDAVSPEVVAVSGWASAESYAALLWAIKNRRRLVMMSDSQARDTIRHPVRDAIKSRFVRMAGAGLVAGRSHKEYLIELGMSAEKIELGYDVVDNDHFEAGAEAARKNALRTRSKYNLPKRYIVASARFIPKKNLEMLVSAYGKAVATSQDMARLIIAGDGDARGEIETLIGDLGLEDRVRLPGYFSYSEMPAIYGLAEGFVHVPTSEQWGLVVNEAAAAGLPIIVSDACGASGELVTPSKNGWRVSPHDVIEIASALTALNDLPPQDRKTMGDASRRIVADWGPDRFAQGMARAAKLAKSSPAMRPSIFDQILFRLMSRKVVETVA